MKYLVFLIAFSATVAWADTTPAPADSDKDQDIPADTSSVSHGQSDSNFGRFVKKSKAEFDDDADLRAQFKNYGQYVSSLRRHQNGDHGNANHGGGSGSHGHGGNNSGSGNGTGTGL